LSDQQERADNPDNSCRIGHGISKRR
jgi:hypothetical protein